MAIEQAIFFFMVLLLIALIIEPVAERIKLPFSSALLLVGYISSEILVYFDIDTGIRWDNFQNLIFYYFIPVLIFEAAFNMNVRLFIQNIFPILFLAIPVVLISTAITSTLLYYAIGHPTGFPWIAALIAGALLSATDPVAVVTLFKKMGVSDRLSVLVDGESLMNDATAIVLVTILISISMETQAEINLSEGLLKFSTIFFGGILIGAMIGGIGLFVIPRITQTHVGAVVTLISAYLSFYVAEHIFHVSGVMAVLLTGLLLAQANKNNKQRHVFMHQLWEFKAYIANAMLFFISGITFQLSMFTDQWLAIIYGILAILISRAIGIYLLLPLLNILPKSKKISIQYRSAMFWGGIRGPITLALALSLPLELPYWWTVQSIAYGVVFFTLFVNAPTMAYLLKKLKL